MTPLNADLLLLALAAVWGSGYTVTKAAIAVIPPVRFLAYRYMISLILSVIFFRKKLIKAEKKDWYAGLFAGILLTASMLIQTIGLQYTSAGKTVFIASAFVIMVPPFYWIVSKEKPKRKIMAAALMMMLGLGLLSVDPAGINGVNKGDILVFLSAVTFAMHTVALGVFAPKRDPFLLSGIQFIVSGLLFLIISFFVPGEHPVSLELIPPVLYSSLIVTFACTIIQVVCQKYTSPNRAAIMINLEAVFGSLIAVVFLGESYTLRMILAFGITFAAVLTAELDPSKHPKKNKVSES